MALQNLDDGHWVEEGPSQRMHRHMARRDGRECESDSRQRRTNPTNGLQALHFPRLTEDGGSAARLGKAQLKPSRRHRAALRPRRFATLSERCSWQARSNRAASDANAKPFTGNDARALTCGPAEHYKSMLLVRLAAHVRRHWGALSAGLNHGGLRTERFSPLDPSLQGIPMSEGTVAVSARHLPHG